MKMVALIPILAMETLPEDLKIPRQNTPLRHLTLQLLVPSKLHFPTTPYYKTDYGFINSDNLFVSPLTELPSSSAIALEEAYAVSQAPVVGHQPAPQVLRIYHHLQIMPQ